MEDVDSTEGFLRERDHTLEVVSLGDIDDNERRLAPAVFDESYRLATALLVQIGDRKRGALAAKCEGGRAADAGAAAGDDGYLAFGVHGGLLLPDVVAGSLCHRRTVRKSARCGL